MRKTCRLQGLFPQSTGGPLEKLQRQSTKKGAGLVELRFRFFRRPIGPEI
ncbi:hypothetical protein BN2475_170036 [Paraburkholderia ribeironis]|uniref:Uncharacterized protein n=1 Tax=Paraburkholderia ribeironis TaxID=1247936 RepID=A0A1N7RUG7_9BURK|nr:hypothetical protein BN2475_170036 [Paraburkholderia ribeironis]